jgi:hypothetical protein
VASCPATVARLRPACSSKQQYDERDTVIRREPTVLQRLQLARGLPPVGGSRDRPGSQVERLACSLASRLTNSNTSSI